jgi:hypothetical protein
MTIVRLRLTGVSPGTSQHNVRLHGIGSGSCHSTRTRPALLGRGVPDSDRRRPRRKFDLPNRYSAFEVTL